MLSAHILYGAKMNIRMPGVWLRLLFLVPVMEVLPFLLMGHAFLPEPQLAAFLYTNMVWAFFASVVIQCLVSIQGLSGAGRLDLFLLGQGGLVGWLIGYTISVCAVYLVSTVIACGALALALSYPVHVLAVLGYALLSLPVTVALVFAVFGFELRHGRTFHTVNLALDVLHVLSCVIFPLGALASWGAMLAHASPLTWLNEFIRMGEPKFLLGALGLGAVVFLLGLVSVRWSVRTYREAGIIGA